MKHVVRQTGCNGRWLILMLMMVVVATIVSMTFNFNIVPPSRPPKTPEPTNLRDPTIYREQFYEIANESVCLLFMDARLVPGIDEAITSVIMNTPWNWVLYVIHAPYHLNEEQPKALKEMPFNTIVQKQKRPIVYKEMPEKYYLQSQNVAASDVQFWESFKEEYILLFHHDSAMCSHPTISLKDFFKYDYIGAPWANLFKWDSGGYGIPFNGRLIYVGNGGFTLRRREWMIWCLKNFRFKTPEDEFYAFCTETMGKKVPPEEAALFATEGVTSKIGSLAIHGVCSYKESHGCDREWVKKWLENCPESYFLFPNDYRCPHCK